MTKASDNPFPSILGVEQGSNPSTPAAGRRRLFPKADGWYDIDDAGAVTGPLGTGGVGGSAPAGKLPVQVKSAAETANDDSLAVTMDSGPTNGNLLIAVISIIGTTNVSSLTQTNVVWTQLAETADSTSPKCEIWKGVVGASAGTGITVAFSANTNDKSIVVSEWNGITGTLDQSASRVAQTQGTLAAGAQSTPAILPTNVNALVIAGFASTNGTTRYGTLGMTAFEPVALNVGSIAGYQWSGYAFPGTTPIMATCAGHTIGNYSSLIVSLT